MSAPGRARGRAQLRMASARADPSARTDRYGPRHSSRCRATPAPGVRESAPAAAGDSTVVIAPKSGGTRSFQLTEGGPLLRVGGVLIHGAVEQLQNPGDAIGEIDLILRLLEESRLWIDAEACRAAPTAASPERRPPRRSLALGTRPAPGRSAAAPGRRAEETPFSVCVHRLVALVERAVLGADVADSAAGQVQRVLRAQFQAVGRPEAEVELAQEEAEQLADGQRDRDCPHLAIRLRPVPPPCRSDPPGTNSSGETPSGHALGQGVEEARVERRAADDKVDAIAQAPRSPGKVPPPWSSLAVRYQAERPQWITCSYISA